MNYPQKCVELLPESLNMLLSDVFVGKCTYVRIAAVGQAMIASSQTTGIHHIFAARTWCSIAPLFWIKVSDRDSLQPRILL